MRIYVKYMVGSRCHDKIGEELTKWGMLPEISQGVIEFQEELDGAQLLQLKESLFDLGFEAVDAETGELLDLISMSIKTLIYKNPEVPIDQYPVYLDDSGFINPGFMQIFSQVYGVDLVQYARIQQVERIKEMLLYEDFKLKEIAEMFQFKSKSQLKRTFEIITGLPPGFYRKIRKKRLKVTEESGLGENIRALKEING